MFLCFFLFEGTFTSFFEDKVIRRHKTVEIKVFLHFHACSMEGSRSGAGYGSVQINSGSGSRRPKNIRILLIRIQKTAWNLPSNFDSRYSFSSEHSVFSRFPVYPFLPGRCWEDCCLAVEPQWRRACPPGTSWTSSPGCPATPMYTLSPNNFDL